MAVHIASLCWHIFWAIFTTATCTVSITILILGHGCRFIPGGSSSGSGAAVGAGLVSFALGTDTAGSGETNERLNCPITANCIGSDDPKFFFLLLFSMIDLIVCELPLCQILLQVCQQN